MKYTILGFSQVKLIEYNLNIIDAHILRWFVDFYQTGKMVKITDEETGRTFCWVKYDAVLDDLPLLGITNTRVIARRFDAMCESGLMRKIVKKTAQGTYSGFCLDPDRFNDLMSSPEGEPVATVPKSTVAQQNESDLGASALKSTVALPERDNGTPTVLKSTVVQQNESDLGASALKSTVAPPERDIEPPTVLKSTVATVPKSTVLLVNSSPNLHPSTKKNPAVAVRTTLFELDKSLVLDAEFYPAAAEFLHAHSLGEDYLRWFYQQLSGAKHIQNLPGYFFKVFFKTVYVERYKAWRETHPDKPQSEAAQEYTCPVCGQVQSITATSSSCDRCDTPVNPTEKEIARYAVFYRMDTTTKERYISDRARVFSSGGNVSEKMLILDQQYGIVS